MIKARGVVADIVAGHRHRKAWGYCPDVRCCGLCHAVVPDVERQLGIIFSGVEANPIQVHWLIPGLVDVDGVGVVFLPLAAPIAAPTKMIPLVAEHVLVSPTDAVGLEAHILFIGHPEITVIMSIVIVAPAVTDKPRAVYRWQCSPRSLKVLLGECVVPANHNHSVSAR